MNTNKGNGVIDVLLCLWNKTVSCFKETNTRTTNEVQTISECKTI